MREISLELFERRVHARQHEDAALDLLNILERLSLQGTLPAFQQASPDVPATVEQVLTRIAAAVVALAADPSFRVSAPGLLAFSFHKREISLIFTLSGFGSPGFVKYSLGTVSSTGNIDLDDAAAAKLLVFATLESLDAIGLGALEKLPADAVASLLFGFLAQPVCVLPAAEANRQRLIRMAPVLDRVALTDQQALVAFKPWMYCSYSHLPTKHLIKSHINDALRRWMRSKGVRVADPVSGDLRERPTLLVPLEKFQTEHAMFRCYERMLAALRSRFRMVALVVAGEIGDEGRALFDEVVELPSHLLDVRRVVDAAVAVRPNAVLYPSLGMAPWTVWLANLRLAPVQMMMGGHPATSASSMIDYFLVPDGVHFDPACFTEKVVVVDLGRVPFTPHPHLAAIVPAARPEPDILAVAVPANRFKIGPQLLAACQDIAARASREVRFHFFPNTVPLETLALERAIRAWLPDAIVHQRSGYAEYLDKLSACDIALGTFPFGATNSAIDAWLIGLPWVSWIGPEMHSGAEWPLLQQLGGPSWLCASDRASFVEAALRLLENDHERRSLGDAFRTKAREHFYRQDGGRVDAGQLGQTIDWLLRNHARIAQDAQRVWTMADRAVSVAQNG